ncbi:TPA: hypothetical protein CPT80_05585 [Candidatus Gastranaerophilales bacterium HUM_9]|nr:MAG TPA: hypothetical protein CPT80_05585 [Candidatus Gastranaerophilales bacterium HUM_9]HBX34481.1 hypothetical protein [Cyanobacteria bacterium UBA11440]
MKKILIILMILFCTALSCLAEEDYVKFNPKTQQWEYTSQEIEFQYDNCGKLIKVGNMNVTYLDNGQMDYIGDMKVKYRKDGKIKEVGKHWFYYDKENKLRAIGNFNSLRDIWGNLLTIGDYWIEYEYVYPYGKRIKRLFE